MKSRRHYRNCIKSIQNLHSKQLLILVLAVISLWILSILYMCSGHKPESEAELKNEILELSVKYVNELAKKQKNEVDGPYSGRFTGYDLKKTFAVLLQNMLERLTSLETRMANGSSTWNLPVTNVSLRHGDSLQRNIRDTKSNIDFKDLVKGAQEKCEMALEDKIQFPECDDKIEWMKKHWRSHKCYEENGVDGTECSIVIYLSEVENYCPILRFREDFVLQNTSADEQVAELNLNSTMLAEKLERTGEQVSRFMMTRIRRNWMNLVRAARFQNRTRFMQNRVRKTIIVYMGFLSAASKLKMSTTLFTGGPLGELVQWTDLIASLFLLGHNILIFDELPHINEYLSKIPNLNVPCQTKLGMPLDIIFTDIIGFNQIHSKIDKFKCLVRILDSFGTQPSHNNPYFMKAVGMRKNTWMGKLLELKQFYTMFPHTSDNTFLGFVVESPRPPIIFPKKQIALVYGKHISMWKNATGMLSRLRDFFEIHATVEEDNRHKLPSYVHNHGFLLGRSYLELLGKSMVFVGLGFPYEGPGPLEAIAHGSVFLNPQFSEDQINKMKEFFKDKPTNRKLENQHPYVSESIGEPFSYLFDMNNLTCVEDVSRRIIGNPLTRSHVPYEFTEKGFLERVAVLVNRQQFCKRRHTTAAAAASELSSTAGDFYRDSTEDTSWPSLQSAHFFLGVAGESCDRTCQRQQLTCENSYTERVMNRRLELQQRGVWCENVRYDGASSAVSGSTSGPLSTLSSPSYEPSTRTCYFQTDHFLFSCSSAAKGRMRFCGCRDSIPGQSALCGTCLY